MIPLIDTHQHLIHPDKMSYAWTGGLPALASRAFTLADYQALTAGRGIAATIFMEADASDYRKEARLVAALACDPASGIRGIVASCRPESAGFEAWLDECATLPVVGLRRILHEVPDAVSRDPAFRANVAGLGRRGLVFDMVYRADQLPLALELAGACPDTRLVLDHCGVPDIRGGTFGDWRRDIRALAARPNVICKLSGVLAYCPPHRADQETIRPYVAEAIDASGPDRCLWGSDWPVVNLTSTLPDWLAAFRALIAALSQDEQAAICNGTAQQVYGVRL